MPTTRPRYQVTETDDIARALDAAQLRWPNEPRSRLVARLIVDNGKSVTEVNEEDVALRLTAIDQYAGAFPGLYAEGYLEALRSDWPE